LKNEEKIGWGEKRLKNFKSKTYLFASVHPTAMWLVATE